MQMFYRKAGESEADLLAAIHKECFPNYWNIDAFSDFFSVSGTHALLMQDGQPLGMLVYRQAHEDADIITVCVLPQARRSGIARALMTIAMASLKEMGAKKLFLDVEDGNSAALALYESLGFTHIRRRKLYYRQKNGSYTDALVMSRKL